MSKQALIRLTLVGALLACIVGAVGTALWTLRFGLFAERPPLPVWHTVLRVLIVLVAAGLMLVRRDLLERVALLCAIVAAGSSALFGLGVRAPSLFAIRLVFHFLAYTIGGAVIARRLTTPFSR